MKNKSKPEIIELNDGHFPEITDRVFCMQDTWDRLIVDHPAIMQTPELKELAEKIQDQMGALYQKCGAKIVD